jgi:hypothetical protein
MMMLIKLEQVVLVAQELTKWLKRVAAKATRKVKDVTDDSLYKKRSTSGGSCYKMIHNILYDKNTKNIQIFVLHTHMR